MFEISVRTELLQFKKQMTALEKQVYPKVVARTLNRTLVSSKSVSCKHIAPMMNTRQSDIKRRMRDDKAHSKKLWASIIAVGSPLKLMAFRAKQTARGVIAKAWNVSKLYKGTFIAPVKHGSSNMTVYTRKTKHSLPVKQLYGPGLAQLFKKEDNINKMKKVVRERLPIEFKNNLRFYASRFS